MHYILKDYLGSFETILSDSGVIEQKLSFDPWGRRRNPTDWTYNNVPETYLFDRGFTGHEHLDNFDLINMNGRVYDPWLGRFLSPDPFVQAPTYSQNYNRYSYALNNPLKYTDPSGYYYGPAKDIINEGYYDLASQTSYAMDYLRGVNNGFHRSAFVNSGFNRLDALYQMDKFNLVLKGNVTFRGAEAQELFKIMSEYNIQTVNGVFEAYDFMLYNRAEEAEEFLAELNGDLSGASTTGLDYFGGGWFSDAYNSAIGRMMVPDFLAIGVGFNGIAGGGGGTSIEFRWVTHGSEASWKPMVTVTQSIGGGFSVDATLNIEAANYIGSVNNITRSMMQTSSPNGDFPTIWGAGGVAAGGKIGVTGYVTPNVGGSFIIGRELNLGAGLPAGPLPANGAGGVSNTWILYDFYK